MYQRKGNNTVPLLLSPLVKVLGTVVHLELQIVSDIGRLHEVYCRRLARVWREKPLDYVDRKVLAKGHSDVRVKCRMSTNPFSKGSTLSTCTLRFRWSPNQRIEAKFSGIEL